MFFRDDGNNVVDAINRALPSASSSAAAPIIAAVRGQLQTDASSQIYTHNPESDTFVIQWNKVRTKTSSSVRLAFQVVLKSNGTIRFYCQSLTGVTSSFSYSTGIQKAVSTTSPIGIGIASQAPLSSAPGQFLRLRVSRP
ncbi:MAG: hypothetical protein Fur0032_08230 [Terrimicrobiaceae bacterium]